MSIVYSSMSLGGGGGISGFCKPFAYIVSSTAEPAFAPVKQDEMR